MDRRMIEYLPEFLRPIREYKAVLDVAEQPTVESAWARLEQALDDQFINTATDYGLQRWESALGLPAVSGYSLADRRFRILSKLGESLPYTETVLRELLDSLCGKEGYTLVIDYTELTALLTIELALVAAEDAVRSLCARILPANIAYQVSFRYNTYGDLSAFTHEQLSQFTHQQLREEVPLNV